MANRESKAVGKERLAALPPAAVIYARIERNAGQGHHRKVTPQLVAAPVRR
jgi:hypothetical protein